MKLRELMTVDVITVGPNSALKEAARRMIEAGVSGLPVTNASGALIGVISEADLVKTEADRRTTKRARPLRWFTSSKSIPESEPRIGDAMTRDVITLGPDSDHAEAARVMTKAGIKRIPIIGENGDLLGLVSRSDILRVFARPDVEIIDEIVDDVMKEVLWIDAGRAEVVCEEGNVVLTGQLETRSDAELLVRLARRLDGVVSVQDRLTWEIDNTKLKMVSPPPARWPRPNW